jgi:hypothetical protein
MSAVVDDKCCLCGEGSVTWWPRPEQGMWFCPEHVPPRKERQMVYAVLLIPLALAIMGILAWWSAR